MPKIEITTKILSDIEICFDLARSIDLHKISTAKTDEKAIEGRTSGLLNLGESVTWQAVHFGIRQKLTSKLTAFEKPIFFTDEQVSGAFKSFSHRHMFRQAGKYVVMEDVFEFSSPFGVIGRVFNALILTDYLRKFLTERNAVIKEFAETEKWKSILDNRFDENP